MAMPITVTGLLANAASIETSSGPLVYNDAVYVFGRGTTGNLVRAFKCSDADTGSFSNVGTDITTTEDITACKACQQGDEIFVVTIDGDTVTTNVLSLHIFNTTSDTWTTTNQTIDVNFTTLSLASAKYLGIVVRSTGDLVVLYNGAVRNISAANRETVRYARKISGTWTAGVEVSNGGANNWYAGGLVLGSSDRVHFFLDNDTAADGFQRTLTSANVLETFPAAYDASVSATEASLCGTGVSYDASGTTKVRYPSRDTGNLICLGLKMDSADAPTISIDADITGTRDMDSGAFRSSYAALGTDLYHVFVDSVDDIYYQNNPNDAGWSSNTLFLTATCNGVLTTIYVREGNYRLAMIYNNSTTPVYNELDLGPASVSVDCTFNTTFDAMTLGATAAMEVAAAFSSTFDGMTLGAAAATVVDAAFNTTFGNITLTAAAVMGSEASFNNTFQDMTLGASASMVVNATLSVTFGDMALTAAADMGSLAVIASLNATFADMTLGASAAMVASAAFNTTFDGIGLTAAANIDQSFIATFNNTFGNITLAAFVFIVPPPFVGTTTMNDSMFRWFTNRGFTGSLDDMIKQYLISQTTGTGLETVEDLWITFGTLFGYGVEHEEIMLNWAIAEGATSTLTLNDALGSLPT